MAECKKKKCLSCVVCSNSIHKCSYESVQYQKKNQNRPLSYMVLYERFWAKKIWHLAKKGDKKNYSLYSWDRYYFFKFTKKCISKAEAGWRGEMFTTTIFFAKFPQLLLLLTDPVLHFSDSYIWIMTVQSYKPLEKSALKVFYIYDGIFPQENKLAFTKHNAVLHRGN